MKKFFLFSIAFIGLSVCPSSNINGQGAAINTSGNTPDPSAIFDVSSAAKGQLCPRLTDTQRNAIVNPAEGLFIFNLTTKCFNVYKNSSWFEWCGTCIVPSAVTASATPNSICQGNTLTLTSSAALATGWSWAGPNGFTSSLQNPTVSNIPTTASGVYTLTASNACGAAAEVNTASVTVNDIPSAPTATAGSGATTNTITTNWTAVLGATGYYLDVANDIAFTSFVAGYNSLNVNNVITYNVVGLNVNTIYYYRARAYNTCGISGNSNTVSYATDINCGVSTVTFTYRGGSVTYGTVVHNNHCWLDRNLGASQVATSYNDINAYGDLFQWGRLDDGHQVRTSATTASLSSSNNPGNNKFILAPTSPSDWRNPQNNALWQGASGINNPCPAGWRIPNDAEWNEEIVSWSSFDFNGAYASPLKLAAAGDRRNDNGLLNDEGMNGIYWTSTVSTTNSGLVNFYNNSAYVGSYVRAYGFSVRCIKN